MSKKKTSIVWTVDREILQGKVNEAKSLNDIIRWLRMVHTGVSYRSLKKRLIDDAIDCSHIPDGRKRNMGGVKKRPLLEVMVEGSTYCTGHLKRRLFRDGLLENVCSICGQLPEWNGKPITLIMDHINGIRDDNRRENLRIVCPHCNMQLDTSNGKNRIRKKCPDCGKIIRKKSGRCMSCSHKISKGRITYKVLPENRPSREELNRLISEIPMTKIGEKYGVSSNSVKKWCLRYGIVLSNRRGYWSKLRGSTPIQTTI